jgi:asparagine synthase (glutamine-hydrolysing)
MCGFVGIFSSTGAVQGLAENIRRMNDRIKHRGPDADGFFIGENAALGHRRLSIIDIATGQQPLWNEDKTVGVAFNGEIYNFLDLVTELKAFGHVFQTKSDTEVIVHAWEQWGVDCVQRFRGMFAFGVIDLNQKLMFIARDRLGVKPLYYSFVNETLIFGSELKALMTYPGLERKLSPQALEEYMALGYVPEPRTIYQSVKKLPSASTLVYRMGDHPARVEPRTYWDISFPNDSRLSFEDAQSELVERLRESIKLRLMSEVPLGAFLSGGVDSSCVVALMSELSDQPVKTCSIGFDQPNFDESKYALEVANRYKADHYLETVSVDDADFLDKIIDVYDEPFADSSAIPTHRVCGMARRKVTVALSGDGADEVFGGYQRYADHLRTDRLAGLVPKFMRAPLQGLANGILGAGGIERYQGRGGRTLRGLFSGATQSYLDLVSLVPQVTREGLWSNGFRSSLQGYRTLDLFEAYAKSAPVTDSLGLVQYLDIKTYLVDDINTKVDRASMDFSLEVREPMMDHMLMEWAGTLPSSFKILGDQRKRLLKSSMETRLPHDLLYRKKMGFAVPVAKWIREDLRSKCLALSKESALLASGVFDAHQLNLLVDSHLKGETDSSPAIWGLLVLNSFLERQEHQGI